MFEGQVCSTITAPLSNFREEGSVQLGPLSPPDPLPRLRRIFHSTQVLWGSPQARRTCLLGLFPKLYAVRLGFRIIARLLVSGETVADLEDSNRNVSTAFVYLAASEGSRAGLASKVDGSTLISLNGSGRSETCVCNPRSRRRHIHFLLVLAKYRMCNNELRIGCVGIVRISLAVSRVIPRNHLLQDR